MSITNDIPQIITFDLEQKDVNLLKEKGFNIKNYTITENYKFNTSNYSIQIDSKFKRIADLHEYEIAVFDLNYKDIFTHIDRGNIIENSVFCLSPAVFLFKSFFIKKAPMKAAPYDEFVYTHMIFAVLNHNYRNLCSVLCFCNHSSQRCVVCNHVNSSVRVSNILLRI